MRPLCGWRSDGARLARKFVDIVPYGRVREWREYAGDRKNVVVIEAAKRKLSQPRPAARFPRGVVIFANSEEFAATYDRLLSSRGVTKYRFVIPGVTK